MLRIFADENIPCATEALSPLGKVTLFKGRELRHEHLMECDALIVRSVTKVGQSLLDGTPVRYVATATAGFEHVNLSELATANIRFASAPGSNATSVVEWVLSALSSWLRGKNRCFDGLSVGIVGCGHVGGRLWKALSALGVRVLPVDPPLATQTGDARYVTLKDLVDVDVLTFHVPHITGGPHPTVGMVSAPFLESLRRKPLLINASRGEVVDEDALLASLGSGRVSELMLDVWRDEPRIRQDILARCTVSTPHIAGYAYTAKLKGLQMIVDDLCAWQGKPPCWQWQSALGPESRPALKISPGSDESWDDFLHRVLMAAYDVHRDSQALKEGPKDSFPAHFDRLRRDYPRRSEWECYQIHSGPLDHLWKKKLQALGFALVDGMN
jgi:erythronate-4-phosphate dehydrogenase